jgi:hypothetical protein
LNSTPSDGAWPKRSRRRHWKRLFEGRSCATSS